jgi:TolB protein
VNGSLTLSDAAPGGHSLTLAGVASNCTVAGDNPRTVQVTAGAQVSVTFTVSCTASVGSIAFASQLQPGVFLVNPDGTGLKELASGGHPIWSPDGKKVLYRGGGGLSVINADGTGQRTLTTVSRGTATVFEWSPDGTMIAFCTQTNPPGDPGGLDSELWLIRADGTGLIRLSAHSLSVSWSPDSRKIVFDNGGSLHLINPDGTGETPLTDNMGAREPEWSPDGTQIAFTGSAFLDIYTIKPDGTGLTNLTNSAAVDIEAKWSPDGSRIAFMTKQSSTEYDIAVMNRDGTGSSVITNTAEAELEPEWSPDGGRIVFTRAGDSREVFVMNADGSDQTQISHMPQGWAGEPDWRR